MKKDKIMVFIPVYNCEKQITRVLSQINDDVLTYVDEIIVVNNLSTDNTVKVTQDYLLQHRKLPCKVINNYDYHLTSANPQACTQGSLRTPKPNARTGSHGMSVC